MRKVLIPPKCASEIRRDAVDFTADLSAGQSLSSATVEVSVYSGVDVTPLVIVPTISGRNVLLATSGGTVGVIYLVRVTAAIAASTLTPVVTYLLAVLPDAA